MSVRSVVQRRSIPLEQGQRSAIIRVCDLVSEIIRFVGREIAYDMEFSVTDGSHFSHAAEGRRQF